MKKYLKYPILFIIFIGSIIFMNNNAEMYPNPILKVTDVVTNETVVQTNNDLKEEYYYETIEGIILNGKYKGSKASFESVRTYSMVYADEYNIKDEVFINLNDDGSVSEVINLRRDKYLVPLFVFMVCMLLAVGSTKGLYTFISLIINISLILGVTYFRDKGSNIFYLFIPATILMCTISLSLTSGINKKTLVAILSSLSSLLITFAISYIIIKLFNNDIPYWYMDYVDILYDYKEVFLISILISGLGAIMDIAISISSTLNELIANSPKISIKALKKSGNALSGDILGTMVNVLLFTSISGTISMLIYVMRNNININIAVNMYAKIELIRFMTGCIGIFVTIPITMYLFIYFFKRRKI